jgi:D-xylose 1-dehydrogenase (NADP+, D-xylono-1,5-lactone-forming)
MNSSKYLRWGVVSSAQIGLNQVIPAIQQSTNGRVVCLGTPRVERVRERAEKLGITRVYDSYAAVLDDPEVEAVYIPLPNSMHHEWTLRAAERGKHVLCEKPMGLTAAECCEMIDACRRHGVRLMEAFMYRFHPQQAAIRDVLESGQLGTLQMVRGAFTFRLDLSNTANIRLSRELWGGALMDVGCYCINAARAYFAAEPVSVLATARIPPELGVDTTLHALLEFERGVAPFVVSLEMASQPQVEIIGDKGRLEAPLCFIPGEAPPAVAVTAGGKREERVLPPANSYQCQVEAFVDAVRNDTEAPLPPEDAVANMRVIEAIRLAVAEGRRVPLASLS